MSGAEYFIDPTIVQYEKLLIAILLGAVLGAERAMLAKQPAGMRTFGLVSMGACLFVLAGSFLDTHYLGVVNFNPSQVVANVVTGVGFLGAGLIIFRGDTLHGVTTAAGLWVAAAIGVSVALGMYAVAVFTTLLTLVMFTGMWYVENRFRHWVTEPLPLRDADRM